MDTYVKSALVRTIYAMRRPIETKMVAVLTPIFGFLPYESSDGYGSDWETGAGLRYGLRLEGRILRDLTFEHLKRGSIDR